MAEQTPRYIEHYPLSQILVRFFIGFLSGFVGTILLGIIMLLMWPLIGTTIGGGASQTVNTVNASFNENSLNGIVIVLVGISIFLATMVTNIVYTMLIPLVDAKYTRKRIALSNIFIGGLVLACIMFPLYPQLSSLMQEEGLALAGALHAILFGIYTIIVLEVVNRNAYLIVSTLGIMLGIGMFVAVSALIFGGEEESNTTITILLILPALMACLSISNTICEGIYGWFYRTYGTDTLSNEDNNE